VVFQNNILSGVGGQGGAAAYNVPYSCRFNLADSTLLTRTLDSAPTDASKGVVGGWFKRVEIGILSDLWCAPSEAFHLAFTTEDKLNLNDGGYSTYVSTQVFRDPGAWFHVVCSYDSDQVIVGDRIIIYYNGKRIMDWASYTPSRTSLAEAWGMTVDATLVRIGNAYNDAGIFAGYIAQTFLVDGLSIQNGDYSIGSFGEFNNNVWRPIDVTGLTFGNNGWLVDFADSSDLGNDVSGNDNNFTSSGFATTDQMDDTPTKNFSTLNSVQEVWTGAVTLSDGGLHAVGTVSTAWNNITGTIAVSSGKWVFASDPNAIVAGNGDLFVCNDAGRNTRATNPQGAANCWAFTFDHSTSTITYDQTTSTARTPSPALVAGDLFGLIIVQDGQEILQMEVQLKVELS